MTTYTYQAADLYDEIDNICIVYDSLIEKLQKNKLLKEDRELLIEALNIVYELRSNQ